VSDTYKRLGVAMLILLAGVIGFGIGRNYPAETRLERECREWATNVALHHPVASPDPTLIPLLVGKCLSGRT